jgi:hypothetical protein
METLKAPPGSFAFGWAISLTYDTLQSTYIALISARRTGSSYTIDQGLDGSPGSACMYIRKSGQWSLQQSFFQSKSNNFGNSVVLQPDGSQFAVGGPFYIYDGTKNYIITS